MRELFKATSVFAAGALIGAAAGLLLAPKTGEQVREQIKDLAGEAKKRAQDFCEQVKKPAPAPEA